MELEHISIENFCSIGKVELKLNQPGLILIQGVVNDAPKADSNGAGKSLLFDAICWCLWGRTVRGLTADKVIRFTWPDGKRTVGKDCCVKLTVTEGADKYVITRHRADTRIDKPNDLKLFINGVEKGRKMKNLQELVDQLIGFDFETFCAMMPGTGIKAASMTDSEIKKLLEKILQTESLSEAYSKAREKLKDLSTQLAAEQAKKGRLEADLTTLEREVGQLRTLEQSFEKAKQARITQHKTRMRELLAEVEAANAELIRLKSLEETQSALFTERLQLEERLLVEVTRPNNTLVFAYQDNVTAKNTVINLSKHEIEKHEKRIAQMQGLGGHCVMCSQEVHESHKDAQIASLEESIAFEKLNIEKIRKEQDFLLSQVNAELRPLTERKTELTGMIAQRDEALKLLNTELRAKAIHEAARARASQDFKRESAALKEAQNQTQNFTELFGTKAAKADELVTELCQCLTAVKKLSTEKQLCEFWVSGFSPAGLRSYMLDYVTPILNDRAAYYSEVLTSGVMKVTFSTKKLLKSGEERDEFQINVDQHYGSESYEGVSIGEKARADLIISMALGDLAAYRTAKQLPWRFLDEPFENIDKTGNDAVINLLNDQKARYKTVFVITHKPSLMNMFTQRVTVTKQDGVSSAVCNW